MLREREGVYVPRGFRKGITYMTRLGDEVDSNPGNTGPHRRIQTTKRKDFVAFTSFAEADASRPDSSNISPQSRARARNSWSSYRRRSRCRISH